MTFINNLNIVGISVRTSNKDNQSAQDLSKLWEQFFAEKIPEKISDKLNDNVYAIYTDYESDYTGVYTAIIGIPVKNINEIHGKLLSREFPAENFQVFKAKGKMPDAVVNCWTDIWKRDKELHRKYTYDFELYGENCQNGENSEVDIFVAT